MQLLNQVVSGYQQPRGHSWGFLMGVNAWNGIYSKTTHNQSLGLILPTIIYVNEVLVPFYCIHSGK